MLTRLRTASQSLTAKILFGLLILSFAVWGIGPIMRSGNTIQTAAIAGDIEIPTARVDGMLRMGLRQMEQQLGQAIPQETVDGVLRPNLVRQLAAAALLDQESVAVGLRVNESLLQQTIIAEPGFRDESGKFSREKFQGLLRQVGLSERDYLNSLRQDVSHNLMRGMVSVPAAYPVELANLLDAYQQEKRLVMARHVKAAEMSAPATPTEDELKAFYDAEGEKYRAPEYRSFSYLSVAAKGIEEAIAIDEATVTAAYNEAPQDYVVPERRDLVIVTTTDKALAEKVATLASEKGLAAAAEAEKLALRPMKGVSKADILPTLADPVFALEKDKSTAALQSPLGWHVLSVTEIAPGRQLSLEEATPKIIAAMRNEKLSSELQRIARELEDTLAGGATLAETAQRFNYPLTTVENVAADGSRLGGGTEENLQQIIPIAFATENGAHSAVHDTPEGMMVLAVSGVIESQIRPMAEVRAEVEKDWRLSRQLEMARTKADEIAAKGLADGTSYGPVGRRGAGLSGLPESALAAIFSLGVGDSVALSAADGAWVVKVAEIQAAVGSETERKALADQLTAKAAEERFDVYGAALWNSYGVEIAGERALAPMQSIR